MKRLSSLLYSALFGAGLLSGGITAGAVTFTTDTLIASGDTTYEGMNLVVSNCTLTVDGSHTFASLAVLNGGDVTHSFIPTGGLGLSLTISGDLTVAAGGAINAAGRGYGNASGSGAGQSSGSPSSGSGAGHGGYGGQSVALDGAGMTYDTIQQPSLPGSGGGRGSGGAGGAGGGYIKLVVGGTLWVDGVVSADAANGLAGRSGGGSGGSIWLNAGSFTGGGVISANGGAGDPGQGGGGAGGRIAIQYTSNSFFGMLAAHGGTGYAAGGAGTIYSLANGKSIGQLLVDNGGLSGTNTPLTSSPTVDLTIQNAAVVAATTSSTLRNLVVASNGWLSVSSHVTLTVTGDATIAEGGGITANGAGYTSNLGPGAGKYAASTYGYTGGGGGYGGYGASGGGTGASGGATYGSVIEPVDTGSGGGCSPVIIVSPISQAGAGGGAMHLIVTGTLLVNGRITADGTPGTAEGSGGGSGGSVWLAAGTLAGAGTVSANGGMGNGVGLWGGGGGGGGRISIGYTVNLFFGVASALGGSGSATGGAGTIYTKANNQSWGQVLVDNGGQAGTNTTFSSGVGGTIDLTVKGGAVFTPPPSQTISTLWIGPGGWLSISNQTLTVTSNATVQAGGGIVADAMGSGSGQGRGLGAYYYSSYSGYVGGGGGNGGYGGGGLAPQYGNPAGSAGVFVPGGNTYGTITGPLDMGSGGGGNAVYSPGGTGGGAVRLTVTGVLLVDGKISAAGGPGANQNAGGGSGGSIYLTVGTLAGAGTINANGGVGSFLGGGGGGGRIAVVYSANTFSGLMSAYGGGGNTWGGAGTIYTKANNQPTGLVLLDNGGQSGTNTSWGSATGTVDLTVKGGAVFAPTYTLAPALGTLLVASNGCIVLASSQGYSSPTLTLSGNATVQAGGSILADGTGYTGGQGQGSGTSVPLDSGYASSGGGHGGYGAASGGIKITAPGGGVYDSPTAPTLSGSGGGINSFYVLGGAGGGAIHLSVTGVLLVDGRISAAGLAGGSANAGGGSGGSVWLTAGTFSGSGVILANGGQGIGLGGGGGGGRIALQYSANVFSGIVSAYGGAGYGRGGAGTIYTKANNQSTGQLVVDNGGLAGTNTAWTQGGTFDLTVKAGGVVTLPSSQTFSSILVASNGWISVSNQVLTVTGNAIIQSGGGIIADATGYGTGQGPGAGGYAYVSPSGYYVGGGGGYGGYGASSGGQSPGGSPYGSATSPSDFGSGGGGSPTSVPAGAGGGAVRMSVTGSLVVDGRVTANGGMGVGQGTGGGSGGSVWLTAGTLAGSGTISANGGAGNELGAGGGGGRVCLQFGSSTFGGSLSSHGGGGSGWGGAGTIYTKANSQAMGQMLVDNAGHYGTNTPLAYLSPFDLTIKAGAVALPSTSYLVLSNLVINAGGTLSCLATPTNVDVVVLRNATIDAAGLISADGKGFAAGHGPGAGLSTNSVGSGAGYGGSGGASSRQPGGSTYGSAQAPADAGSGGGFGFGTPTGGSEGGGALRLSVAGTLMANGRISAGGNAGRQDSAGGGSGGSIWLSAGALAGAGTIAADGGAGELYNGGGGGGGRIAIYSPLNVFGGKVSVAGGDGAFAGQPGSIYYASASAGPQVVSSTPSGTITGAVSSLEVTFSSPLSPYAVSATSVSLTAPGSVGVSSLAVAALSPNRFQITCPEQMAEGTYTLSVGPQIQDILGHSMSAAYTGTFTIAWALVQGTVTDAQGHPMPGVVLQADDGMPAITTGADGKYALSLPPAGTYSIAPLKAGFAFVPGSRSYSNLAAPAPNDCYAAMNTFPPAVTVRAQTNGCLLTWYGATGVTYQPLYSTNLMDWLPYDVALPGVDGPMQAIVPSGTERMKFFRVGASY